MLTFREGVKISVIIILVGFFAVIAFAAILYYWFADTPANNLRRAVKHHKIGEMHSQKGNNEEAKLHFEAAKQFREKALRQKGGF